MFKNRSLHVKVVRDAQQEHPAPVDYEALVQTIVQGMILVVISYMAADTLRKILVHTVATKIN